jgi:hypothetical protein
MKRIVLAVLALALPAFWCALGRAGTAMNAGPFANGRYFMGDDT